MTKNERNAISSASVLASGDIWSRAHAARSLAILYNAARGTDTKTAVLAAIRMHELGCYVRLENGYLHCEA